MKCQPSKSANSKSKKNKLCPEDQLWQPLDTDQSESISGGLVLLFANPFA